MLGGGIDQTKKNGKCMEETHKTDKATTTSTMWYKCTQTHYGIIICTYVSVCFKSAKVTHKILPQIREISKQQRGDTTCALGQASAMPWQMSASAGFLLACIHTYIHTNECICMAGHDVHICIYFSYCRNENYYMTHVKDLSALLCGT